MKTKHLKFSKTLFYISLFTLIIALIMISCSEQSTSPSDKTEDFGFSVKVVDADGTPQQNMKIGLYYHPDIFFLENFGLNKINQPDGITSINYSIGIFCDFSLKVYDLEDNSKFALLIKKNHPYGDYEINYLDSKNVNNGIYKCIMEAKDTGSTELIFADTIYFAALKTEPQANNIGVTGTDGIFNTANKLHFPSLYKLPQLVQTGDSPSPLGTFAITDTITILVTDANTNVTSRYKKTIKDGDNYYVLTFPVINSEDYNISKRLNSVDVSGTQNIEHTRNLNIINGNIVGFNLFNVIGLPNKIELIWVTSWEKNNQGFEVQRKLLEGNFETIGFVNGSGTTNNTRHYYFTDTISYDEYIYRLKVIAFDGSYEYSDEVLTITAAMAFSLSQNYPNPFN